MHSLPFCRLLICVCLPLASVLAVEGPIVIGWEPWPPYNYRDKDGNLRGLDVDLAKHYAEVAHIDVVFEEMPWVNLLREIEAGTMHMALGATPTPERKEWAHFTTSYRNEQMDLFIHKDDHSKYAGIKSFADFVAQAETQDIVHSRDYFYGETAAKLITDKETRDRFYEVSFDRNGLMMLIDHRVQAQLGDPVANKAHLENLEGGDAIESLMVIHQTPVSIMLSKKAIDQKVLQRFNAAIEQAEEDGSAAAIRTAYGLSSAALSGATEGAP